MTALSSAVTRHDRSAGTGPASIGERAPGCIASSGTSRVEKRSRIARGLTKSIANGSAGSRSYSVPGNSFAFARASPGSSFAKLSPGSRVCRSHASDPRPVAASKLVRRPATKYDRVEPAEVLADVDRVAEQRAARRARQREERGEGESSVRA